MGPVVPTASRWHFGDFWSVVVPSKCPDEIEAEQFVVYWRRDATSFVVWRGLRFQRWMLLLAAVLTQIVNGALYSRSLVNSRLDAAIFKNEEGHAVVAYYIACGWIGFASALFGPYVERHGPRAGVLLGGFLIILGHLAAGMSVLFASAPLYYIGYGVLVGIGVGITYIAPISALQKWFPDLRGTAAGFGVCGFGLGASGWGPLYDPLIEKVGLSWLFVVVALMIGVLCGLAALIMRTPPPNFRIHGQDMHGWCGSTPSSRSSPALLEDNVPVVDFVKAYDYLENELDESQLYYHNKIKHLTLRECILSMDFAILYLTYLTCVATGIIGLSSLATIATNVFHASETHATQLVTITSIFNFFGRILLPMASDMVIRYGQLNPACGRKLLFVFSLICQLIILLLLPHALRQVQFTTFRALFCWLTFVYGGTVGAIPSLTTDLYGVYNTGTMHGVILTCWSLCAVIGGLTFNHNLNDWLQTMTYIDAYARDFGWLTVVVAIGCGLILLVRTNPVDRFYPGWQYTIWRFKIVLWTNLPADLAVDISQRTI
ncbi:unnamed protein product [Aphanomyces euteiches]